MSRPDFLPLDLLEAESIHILREVAAESTRPAILRGEGASWSVLLRLAQKAFYPGEIPFPLLDDESGMELRDALISGRPPAEGTISPLRWNLYNGRVGPGENRRIFPLFHWTEGDLWEYILREDIPLPPPYLAEKLDRISRQNGSPLPKAQATIAEEQDFRFPVQGVIRPDKEFRGYSGQVVSGKVKPGQEVVALPSLRRNRIKAISVFERQLEDGCPPLSVVLTLTDPMELDRGDILVDPEHMPAIATRITASLTWYSETPGRVDSRYILKHTTRTLCGRISRLDGGLAEIELERAIFCDLYARNHATGSFLLIDPVSSETVAAGMIQEIAPETKGSKEPCFARGRGLTVWFTGLSGAGKTTLCRAVGTELLARGLPVEIIDGDLIRKHLSKGLGFSKEDRDENIRRIAFIAQLLTRNGTIVLASVISPYRAARDEARRRIENFLEVYVAAPLSICEIRDPKELYKKARSGQIHGFTGVDDPYEPPLAPEIVCHTERESIRESSLKVVSSVLRYLSAESPK